MMKDITRAYSKIMFHFQILSFLLFNPYNTAAQSLSGEPCLTHEKNLYCGESRKTLLVCVKEKNSKWPQRQNSTKTCPNLLVDKKGYADCIQETADPDFFKQLGDCVKSTEVQPSLPFPGSTSDSINDKFCLMHGPEKLCGQRVDAFTKCVWQKDKQWPFKGNCTSSEKNINSLIKCISDTWDEPTDSLKRCRESAKVVSGELGVDEGSLSFLAILPALFSSIVF